MWDTYNKLNLDDALKLNAAQMKVVYSCVDVCPVIFGTQQPFSRAFLPRSQDALHGWCCATMLALLQLGFPLLPADLHVTGVTVYPGRTNNWWWMPGLQEVGSTELK